MLVLIEAEPQKGKTTLFKDLVPEDKILWIDLENKKAPKFIRSNTQYYKPRSPKDVLNAIAKASQSDKYNKIVIDGLSRYSDFLEKYFQINKITGFDKWGEYLNEFNELVSLTNSVEKLVVGINHEHYDSATNEMRTVAKGDFGKTGGYTSHVDFAFRIRSIDGTPQLLTDSNVSRVPYDFETEIEAIYPFKKKDEQDYTIIDLLNEVEEYYRD